jgi:N-acetyl-anhydromuramyl-L-alanine amidase AmpD
MSRINNNGMLIDNRIQLRRSPTIEHGQLSNIHAVVVHQTDAPTAQHTFNSYDSGGNGAHFLIGKNGQIYQTASINKRCYHVGRLIKSKCLTIKKENCNSVEMAKILTMSWSNRIKAINSLERTKNYPNRYPLNSDSIGIELVGKHIDEKIYEAVTPQQNTSLIWLVGEIYIHCNLALSDIYTHPEVSYKNPGEASTAVWQ